MCYAQLILNLSDAIARFKICGGHGLTHTVHFCLYCQMKLFYIALPKGFIRKGESVLVSGMLLTSIL